MSALKLAAYCRKPMAFFGAGVLRHSLSRSVNKTGSYSRVQLFASQAKSGSTRSGRLQVCLLIGGGAAAGYGALTYFEQMFKQHGAIAKPALSQVRNNIIATFSSLGLGMGINAVSAFCFANNPMLKRSFLVYTTLALATTIGSGMLYWSCVESRKYYSWEVYQIASGALFAPLVGSKMPVLFQALFACYGFVGAMIYIADEIPIEQIIENTQKMLSAWIPKEKIHKLTPNCIRDFGACALGTALVSTLLPPSNGFGGVLFDISVAGCLVMFPWLTINIVQSLYKAMEINYSSVFVGQKADEFDPRQMSMLFMWPVFMKAEEEKHSRRK